MSVLSAQADELRSKAKLLRSHADGLAAPLVMPSTKELMALTMLDSASRMEEAADTIEGLRDRLQEEGDALRDYRASQIAAEAERRLQESYGQVPEQGERENGGERESCSRWHDLFGTPEKAARTLENGAPMCDWCDTNACEKKGGECSLFNYDALLDWLMGESE